MVNWDATNDRYLLLLALKQLKGSLDYKRLADEFGQNVTLNTLRIRICQLRKQDDSPSPQKAKTGRITKESPLKKAAQREIKPDVVHQDVPSKAEEEE